MNEEETELARQLVALPGFPVPPPPGVLLVDALGTLAPVRMVAPTEGIRVRASGHALYRPSRDASDVPEWPEWVPDIHDPATAGVLLGMLAATGRLTCVYPPGVDNDWRVDLRYQQAATGPTLGVACARALVALEAA